MSFTEDGDKLVALPPAPPKIPPELRGDILATMPDGRLVSMRYEVAEKFHKELGQELARKIRRP